ncbi:MAG: GAF and ANTAR domain-containing protein [Actinomycetota bacterium]|nr:GAF and ANTAR domain-containing protein [Actinomycetota bacterium]
MSAPLEDELGRIAARASGLLLADQAASAALDLLTSTAVQAVARASGAGITLTGPDGRRTTTASTDPLVEAADALQYALEEGPCLTAWRSRSVVLVRDAGVDRRWPAWGSAAAATGIASVLSAPLVAGDTAVGAIKVYALEPAAFDEGDASILAMFAAQSAVLVTSVHAYRSAGELSEDVREMLVRRDSLSRATGLLMGREGLSEQSAFAHLMAVAARDRLGMHEVAARVLSSHRARR